MARILLVDDELKIRELVQRVFSLDDHDVVTVPDTAQALDALFRSPFDVVIMDIQLGAESGIEALKKIRQKNTTLPVVIYSGYITPEIEIEAKEAGASEILRKDMGVDTLLKQITRIVKAKEHITLGKGISKKQPILVVDDDEKIRGLLRTFFEGKGYKVLGASNGQEAVKVARTMKLSVVLLDMEMPVMNGLQALPQLLEADPQLGIVMASGIQDDDKVKQAIDLGAYGYVLKPFDFLYLELVVFSRLAIAQGRD